MSGIVGDNTARASGVIASAGGGAWEYVATVAASGGATVVYEAMVSGYDYRFEVNDVVPSSDGVDLMFRVGVAGPTYRDDDYISYGSDWYSQNATRVDTTETTFITANNSSVTGNLATEGNKKGWIEFNNPADASSYTAWEGGISVMDQSTVGAWNQLYGYHETIEAHTCLQLYYASGNVATGNLLVYRRTRS